MCKNIYARIWKLSYVNMQNASYMRKRSFHMEDVYVNMQKYLQNIRKRISNGFNGENTLHLCTYRMKMRNTSSGTTDSYFFFFAKYSVSAACPFHTWHDSMVTHMSSTRIYIRHGMGWLWLVGSLKLQVSFAKEPYNTDDTLQKKPIILRRLLIVATPYTDLTS